MNTNLPFDLSKSNRYVEWSEITAVGGTTTITIKIDSQIPFYVRRHCITVHYLDPTASISRAVAEEEAARDLFLVDVATVGAKLSQNPLDVFAFNAECEDRNYPGYILAEGTQLTFTIFHKFIGAANCSVPIKVGVALFGYNLKKG